MGVEKIIEDVGGREEEFTLEMNGFMYAKQDTKVMLTTEDLEDTEKITSQYYPEMEKWLKEVTGAPRALIIHHGVRISNTTFSVNSIKKEDVGKKSIPQAAVLAAHLDQSSWQAGQVLHNHFPEECETLMHGRWMLVNAWRPIKPVYKHPFGVADASTVPHSDLVIRQNRWMKDIRESMGLVPNDAHRWYYKYGQGPDDVLIFKQFDNHGKARACPHTAFVDDEFEDAAPRESIELRAILMWPEHESVLAGSGP
ncbi:hypothetical protein K402DRAFT_327789 [Aulographum hederae CBS 113979]|uniref:Uncharacterized protein n=1 Tax=Aulographum hederae CBS 113979 TaxID=1176131 RepID=A0A6G1H739_9PEZI|nr:hypothetical protein K402DRAFT_327789 [Aulographum hederae CBS 113979]